MPKAKTTNADVQSIDPAELDKGNEVSSYAPKGEELKMQRFLKKRIFDLKEARRNRLPGIEKNIEKIWTDADRDFTPHELGLGEGRKRFEADEETGLRSRLVKVGDDNWQSDSADPVFYVKVSTALAILVDLNPEAVFLSNGSKYEANRALAYANWKNSWENSGAKQQVKLFAFNMAKYGTAFAKTYPKIVEIQKTIITEVDPKTKKRKTQKKRLVQYNDLCRKSLNPWKVWISEMARPGDPLSVDDWYHEEEYSWERLQQEFPVEEFPNMAFVKKGSVVTDNKSPELKSEDKSSTNVTVGYYENQRKDKYAIYIPAQNIVLYQSPLPNDDGMLSLWMAPWTLRHDESIYGIGIYEIIRQDAALYNRLKNMTIDQLTLSIYKMFFHKGLDQLGQDGRLVVTPGVGEQVSDPAGIKFLEVPGPGDEAWRGIASVRETGDTNSGVPVQLTGKFDGKTLGQDIQAKETALQRMKLPLDFLLDALQQEAYVSLSWQKQILSTPEVLEWASPEELAASLKEMGLTDEDIKAYLQEALAPTKDNKLVFQNPGEPDETGNEQPGTNYAHVYREVGLNLEQDDKGELIESKKNQFYRFGVNLPLGRLDWKGIVRIKPQSVLAPSKDLEKRNDLDLYNLVFPSIQAMAANPMLVPVLMPPIKQIIKIFEKDIKDWIDEPYFMKLYQDASQPKPAPEPEVKPNISMNFADIGPILSPAQEQILAKFYGVKIEKPLFVDANNPAGGMPQASSAQPAMAQPGAAPTPDMSEGVQGIEPVAPIGQAPSTLGGAVSASQQGT